MRTESSSSSVRRVHAGESSVRDGEVSRLMRAVPSAVRFVGRVGALAIALGVGSASVAVPLAFADRTGSGGSTQACPQSFGATAPSPIWVGVRAPVCPLVARIPLRRSKPEAVPLEMCVLPRVLEQLRPPRLAPVSLLLPVRQPRQVLARQHQSR